MNICVCLYLVVLQETTVGGLLPDSSMIKSSDRYANQLSSVSCIKCVLIYPQPKLNRFALSHKSFFSVFCGPTLLFYCYKLCGVLL